MRIPSVLIGAALVHCSFAQLQIGRGLSRGPNDSDPESIWIMLNSSESLDWQGCYPSHALKLECTRLLVPLNYLEPISSSNRASIALIRTLSSYPPTSHNYKGPLIFNPGGPGGSGVDIVVNDGSLFREYLGDAFDILSFDPRGFSRSTPSVSFFSNDADREIWTARANVFTVVNASTNSLSELVADSQVIGKLAGATNHNGYLNFINTDHTARDILQIIKAYVWDKIQYWGVSYGSILGATFASLFPNNVGRLIIDGVPSEDDYFGNRYLMGILDTDKVFQAFFDSCFDAGPSECAFYAPSPEAISRNLNKLYDITKTRPFPVFLNASSYGIVDYNLLRNSVFQSLYFPNLHFSTLANVLAELSKGNAEPLWKYGSAFNGLSNAEIAITCNDGALISGTLEDAKRYFTKLAKTSEWADVWANSGIICSGWPNLTKNFFRGPLTANTSHPILLIGNTADPVTLLANAKKLSKAFPGSIVLTQNSSGHTSISGTSICTRQYVQAYSLNGTLPAEGTVCPVLGSPFNATGTSIQVREETVDVVEGRAVVDAIVELSKMRHISSLL